MKMTDFDRSGKTGIFDRPAKLPGCGVEDNVRVSLSRTVIGRHHCEALMSALNFICSAREGEEIRIADDMAIPRTAEMETSLLLKISLEIWFPFAACWRNRSHASLHAEQAAALRVVQNRGWFE